MEGELQPPRGGGGEEVVVDEVVAAEGDQHKSVVHELLRLGFSDECGDPLLVLLEELQLLGDSDYVDLQKETSETSNIVDR